MQTNCIIFKEAALRDPRRKLILKNGGSWFLRIFFIADVVAGRPKMLLGEKKSMKRIIFKEAIVGGSKGAN